jgi:antitoxin HicB
MKKKATIGSDFDDFLKEEGIYEDVCATALKRVLAAQIAEEMERQHKTVSDLAREMKTSRAQINRLLDQENSSLSLKTLARVASALGRGLRLELA